MKGFLISGFNETENNKMISLLNLAGLNKPNSSKFNNLSILEINNILIKENEIKRIENYCIGEVYKRKEINKSWGMLGDDLVLGNINNNWTWSCKNNILLLDYWRNQDDIKFIFIYEHPCISVSRLIKETQISEKIDIENLFYQWKIYYKELLCFYELNKEKTIILGLENISDNYKKYLNILNKNLDVNLNENFYLDNFLDSGVDQLVLYLTYKLFSEDRSIQSFYNELQKKTSFSCGRINSKINIKEGIDSYFSLLIEKNNLNLDNLSLLEKNSYLENEKKYFLEKKLILKKEILKLQESVFDKIEIIDKIENCRKMESEKNSKNIEDNLILSEKLKSIEKENSVKESKIKDFQLKNLHLLNEKKVLVENIRNIESKLKAIGNEIIKTNEKLKNEKEARAKQANLALERREKINELSKENKIIFERLKNIQECQEKKFLLQKNDYLSGESDLILEFKNQLPYRIGNLIINNSKSLKGIIQIPSKVIFEKNNIKSNKVLDLSNLDAESKEKIESVKNHLSYKLGETIVENMQSPKGIIKIFFTVPKEILIFKFNEKNKKIRDENFSAN
ncbi:coiled-coil domain-containing protein [Acinetobacter soli]|uniref:hypothetical protein n=1 Tax=Acinetobacter soli TaxID=487316 RepID=UPI001BAACED6|nr:hypothetical protein [Acinetobacter soli]